MNSLKSLYGKIRSDYPAIALCCLFLICAVTGLIAGEIIKSNIRETDAAGSNITVTDGFQSFTEDQATINTVVTKTSTVTVQNPSATHGYTLTARIAQNTLAGATVTIGSSVSLKVI